ncbi:NAD(P)/FAD-dependent oxidoreductase [Nocardiopsis sp. NPDC006139]|uniref:NAD(P)/FAD-dependent oxidoreductase n=1 Tax=Nocardiopsis sp. NPDC006139 TaxID=3154578 RepID=UPI00339DF23F
MSEEKLVVVLSDPDRQRLEALRETLDDWLGNDARLITTPDLDRAREALRTLSFEPSGGPPQVVVVADEDAVAGETGRTALSALGDAPDEAVVAETLLLTARPPAPDGIGDVTPEYLAALRDEPVALLHRPSETEDLALRLTRRLLPEPVPEYPLVVVFGDQLSPRAHRTKRFLALNWINHLAFPSGTPTDEIWVLIEWGSGHHTVHADPSLTTLAKELGLFQRGGEGQRFDLVVTGGGPAGLAGAVSSAAMGFSTLVLEDDSPGGQAGTGINRIENYLGFPGGIPAPSLIRRALSQVMRSRYTYWMPTVTATALEREILSVDLGQGNVELKRYRVHWRDQDGATGTYSAGMVLLACGRRPRRIGAQDEEKYVDRGLYYDALPGDADLLRPDPGGARKKVVIVGGGDTAGRAAVLFSAVADVTLVVRSDLSMGGPLREEVEALVKAKKVTLYKEWIVRKFVAGDIRPFSHVVVHPTRSTTPEKTIPADFVFALIGGVPATEWLRPPDGQNPNAARVARDGNGFVLTEQIPWPYPRKYKPNGEEDPDTENQKPKVLAFQTTEEGLFAAGDVRAASVQRIAQAAGEGTAATVSMDAHLRRRDNAGLVLGDTVSKAYRYYRRAGK